MTGIIKREHHGSDECRVVAISDRDDAGRANDDRKGVHGLVVGESPGLVSGENLTDPLFCKVSQNFHIASRDVFAVGVNIN